MSKLAIKGGKPVVKDLAKKIIWPIIHNEDKKAVVDCLKTRKWCRIFPGSNVEKFEKAFAKFHHAKHAVATANGTVSLQLALRVYGVKAGDEVIVPALTFIATVSAVTEIGAIPVFADSDPDTLAISADAIENAVTPRTRAVIGVHYGGYPIDFDAILPIVKRHNLFLIEDAAHAHGTEWKGRRVGAIGDMGSFSFQETKSLTAGEGGIVLTDNDKLAEEARLIHSIGRVMGCPGYEHYILSSNYRLSEIQGALLLSQLKYLKKQIDYKHRMGEFLRKELNRLGIGTLKPDSRITKRGYYFFVMRYKQDRFKGVSRDKFLDALQAEGVPVSNGYGMPLYKQPAFKKEIVRKVLDEKNYLVPDYKELFLPVAETTCKEQITLLHYYLLLDKKDIQRIIDAFSKLKDNIDELR